MINGARGAWRTNQLLQLQAGTYVVALAPPDGVTPPQIKVVLRNTDVENPATITFRTATP